MKIKNKISIILTILATLGGILLMSFDFSSAQATREMEVTAYMTDGQSKEIPNGEYDVRFAIYTADRQIQDPYPSDADSGQKVWEEVQKVTMIDGILTARLGSVTPLPDSLTFSGGDYYLGVRVNTDSEMVPRRKITAVPLAINALNAGNALLLQGAKLGTSEGDIAQYGKRGKISIKQLPTGTGSGNLVLGNDSRLQDSHAQNTDTGTSGLSFNIGDGTGLSGNNFDLSVSNAAAKPTLRYNGSAGTWQYSNDGSSFTDIGSGVNILTADDGVGGTSSNSGLELAGDSSDQLALLQGCSDAQVLSWDETNNIWECATVSGVSGVSGSGVAGQVAYWTAADTIAGENNLAISRGGTGAGTAADARTNLGLVIGTDVQGYNASLAAIAGGTWTGAASITTIGTIGLGVWNGTDIDISDYTNLAATTGLVLTGDQLTHSSANGYVHIPSDGA